MAKSLIDILPEFNIAVQESSSDRYVAICPFHEGDREPSFTIYANDTYFCFGCNAWGDPVKFLCDYKGWEPKEAQAYVGVNYEYKKAEKAQVIKTRDSLRTWEFLYRTSQIYHANLLRTNGAYRYLRSRGLLDDTIISNKIGYTDGRVLDIQFASDFRIAHECGIINQQGYEVMGHRITIPNFCGENRVDFIMGRTVTNDRVKYLGTRMPKPMMGFYEIAKSPVIFTTEGQFDWLILKQWGFPAIVISGTHLPKHHLALLRDKTVIIVPDNDKVGQTSAKTLNKSLRNSYILNYESLGVKDVGELGAQERMEDFYQVVREQEWLNYTLTSKTHLMKWLPI